MVLGLEMTAHMYAVWVEGDLGVTLRTLRECDGATVEGCFFGKVIVLGNNATYHNVCLCRPTKAKGDIYM